MKFWPARGKYSKNVDVVTDLDAIIAEPVHFRFNGKIHRLNPIALDEYLKFTNAQARMFESLKNDEKKLNTRELAELYHKLISSVCDSITVQDIMEMAQVQVAALYQLVIDVVTGQVKMDEHGEKKNRQKIPLYESVLQTSSPSAPESSDGPGKSH